MQREEVGLGGEEEVVHVEEHLVVLGEHQIEVLERLGVDERVDAVLVAFGLDVGKGRVAALDARVLLQLLEHVLGHLQVVVVVGRLVQVVGRLEELGPQRMARPVHAVVEQHRLGQEVVLLHYLMQILVHLDGALDVALHHLNAFFCSICQLLN